MAPGKEEKKLKGVYLVPDPLMMKPHFGPSEHIKVGLKELQKYFDIELLVLGNYEHETNSPNKPSITKGVATQNGFIGMLRDIKLLVRSNRKKSSLVKELKERNVEFIYERGQYLDLRGVRAAKSLGVKHFYEVNWLNFLGIRQFYQSWFNPVAKRIEEYSYKNSTLNFFIGTQHKLIDIPANKVSIIQNGIHQSLIAENSERVNTIDGKIKICYVANLMPHHRFDLFIKALDKQTELIEKIELHLVGYNFEQYAADLPPRLSYHMHGPTKKEDLPQIMAQCNIGLISGGPSYSSFMKLFEYAAFKLCVICPDLENIKFMFTNQEILFFKTDDAFSLANTLQLISANPEIISQYGSSIYKKVEENYTWENIYKSVSEQIKEEVGNDYRRN